jgi:hypothetical protein
MLAQAGTSVRCASNYNLMSEGVLDEITDQVWGYDIVVTMCGLWTLLCQRGRL